MTREFRENLHLPTVAGEVLEIGRSRRPPSILALAVGAAIGVAATVLTLAVLATRSLHS